MKRYHTLLLTTLLGLATTPQLAAAFSPSTTTRTHQGKKDARGPKAPGKKKNNNILIGGAVAAVVTVVGSIVVISFPGKEAEPEPEPKEVLTEFGKAITGGTFVDVYREIDQDADIVDKPYNNKGDLPIHYVIARGDDRLLELLCEEGIGLEPKDKDGNTPLQAAVLNGKLAATEILIRFGANAKAVDKQGRTLLQLAQKKGINAITQAVKIALLPQAPDPDDPDELGRGRFRHWAVHSLRA